MIQERDTKGIASFGRRQDCNAPFFGRRPYYIAPYFGQRHMANYNGGAGQKVAQKLKRFS